MREHIAEARAGLSNEMDADLLNILDRLGDPAETAAPELGRAESPASLTRPSSRRLEIAAIVLLLLFWPVGVILLWSSDAWTTRQKLIGTLVPPGGYLGIFVLGPVMALGTIATACRTVFDEAGNVISSTCPAGATQTGIDIGLALILVLYLIGPILSAAYLAACLRRKMSAERSETGTGPSPSPIRAAGHP